MKPVKPVKTETYVEPEIQDITPVSVVRGTGGQGTGLSGEQEGED